MTDRERLVTKYLVKLRDSFTLDQHYQFIRECRDSLPKGMTVEAYMDELAVAAHQPIHTQEYVMAKASVKATAAPKAEKATPTEKKAGPIREPKIASTAKIVWLVKENPKRAGTASHERFAAYFGTKTVEAFLEAGGSRADLANDTAKEYMSVA